MLNGFDVEDLLLSITNFCLGSCVYCNLKDLETFEFDQEWLVQDAEGLFTDKYLDGLKNIHLTGGEPILSPKLWETCKLIKKYHPDVRMNMPVSGFFPYTTYRYVKKIHDILPQLRIDISVDATSKGTHELTRGKGSWEPVNKTIELLGSIEGLKVQLQLSLTESNIDEIGPVQDWAKSLGFGFYLCFPHSGTRFGHKKDASFNHEDDFIEKAEKFSRGWRDIRPLNERIWITQRAIWEGKDVRHDCFMGRKSLDVDPFGNVYPCMCYYKNQILGNIKFQSLTEILESHHVKEVLDAVTARTCQPCIMPVAAWKKNTTIDGEPLEVG